MSEFLQSVTYDENDLEKDESRDDEIKGDKPPHHG